MLGIIILSPIVLGIAAISLRSHLMNRIALVGSALINVLALLVWWSGYRAHGLPGWLASYLSIDAMAFYFLAIMSLVYFGSTIYTLTYFKEHHFSAKQETLFVSVLMFFLSAMIGVVTAHHLALLWVFIEATTLTSALLIYFEQRKASLEAAWKYIYICSVGIALAFVGIIILSIGSKNVGTLFFNDLYHGAAGCNQFWLKLSFAFIIVGFGTKIGVAPIHAWLPDAHSEAPSPVSALLSGTLLNTAFLGLVRVYNIMKYAELQNFANILLLLTGFMSLFVCAVFMLQISNYKRMLAYSSIENMGLLFIGLALGGPGVFAAFLHACAHSISKTCLFLTSGNILSLYGSKQIKQVKGMIFSQPLTGWLWLISFLALAGMPPFPIFLSKFLLISAFIKADLTLLIIPFFLCLIVIFYGMGGTVFNMVFGSPGTLPTASARLSPSAFIPQLVLLMILLGIGVHLPPYFLNFLQDAVQFLKP
ncbi:MAG: hypothetical protein EHM72_12095 [Calditrichaeota bacterium]|nr:MAG: hypothetical protein EHM72_12095 [Calditrichota bacterium]